MDEINDTFVSKFCQSFATITFYNESMKLLQTNKKEERGFNEKY